MTLPITTNRVSILRDASDAVDPYVDIPPVTIATHVRCVIGSAGGNERNVGGSQQYVSMKANFDLGVDVTYKDRLLDEDTGDLWEIAWTQSRIGFGLDHIEAGLFSVKGSSIG